MKKLLLLLVIIFCACSPEKTEEEPWEQQYLVSIMDACEGGTKTSYCISKEEFDRVFEELRAKPPQGPSASCGGRWTISFRDKDGVQRTGFSAGMYGAPNACINNM